MIRMQIVARINALFFKNKPYICFVMENDVDFQTYLVSKKIDPTQFKTAEPELFDKLSSTFQEMSPQSFTAQKLFLINPIRRKYKLEEKTEEIPSKPKVKFKPKIR